MTFDLGPTDLNIKSDHLRIEDYLPSTQFEVSGAKCLLVKGYLLLLGQSILELSLAQGIRDQCDL